jgi:hypothetical protein
MNVTTVCVIVLSLSSVAAAQTPPEDLRGLAAAVAAERQRIAEIQAELERRSQVLSDLSTRLESLSPTAAAPPAATVTPPDQGPPALERAAEPLVSVPRFDFYGESKVRYETLRQDYAGCVGCPNRQRGRLRLRFGAEGHLSPDFKAVVGFGIGELNDPNTVYTNLGGTFSRKVATWDRGYVEYHPVKAPWIDLTAGKFPYNWLRSSMTFDVDFYPEGMSEKIAFDVKRAGMLKAVSVQGFQLIANEQPVDLHSTVVGTQFIARLNPAARVSTVVAVTGVEIGRPELVLHTQLDGSNVGVRNTNATILEGGQTSYASAFRYANLILENTVKTPWDAMPVTVGLEFQRNLRAVSDRNTGTSIRIDAGRALRQGDWDFSWHLFRVEQDAIMSAFGESDWRAPSNVLQQRYAVNRMMHPNVQLSFTLYRGRTLDSGLPGALLPTSLPRGLSDPWMNRVYLDVTYRY